jgi:hypothetical protein
MNDRELPAEIRLFLDRCVDSIEQLEVLLLLWSNRPRILTTESITRDIGSAAASIRRRLQALERYGLVDSSPFGFAYRPDPAHDPVVALVFQAYRERRVSVITYVVTNPGRSLRAFSDAFRLRDPGE